MGWTREATDKEYTEDGTVIETTRCLIKLTEAGDETAGNSEAIATKLSSLAIPDEVKENAAIQAQLANLFTDALKNERIRQDVIKEVPIRFSLSRDLTKDDEKFWKKTRNIGARGQGRECLGIIKNRRKKSPVSSRDLERVKEHPENWK